jgi:hypothetical protein
MTKSLPILLSAAVAISISGCAEKRTCAVPHAKPVKVSKPVKIVTNIQDTKDKQIEALQVAILEAKKNAGKTVTNVVEVAGESSPYPPNAEPGKCYKKVLIPAKYEMQTEKVLAKEADERITIIPAKYQTVTKKILVKEASERLVAVPATYKTITEKVMSSEASERLVKVPATYTTTTEKILVKEATTSWKKGCSNGSGSCDTLCLVNIPAQYRTVTKRILQTPASVKSVPIPETYKTVTRKVLNTPASTKVIPVPAVYKTVQIREMVEPATVQRTVIPETYQSITKRVKVSDSELKWQESVCKQSMTQVSISSVQTALKDAGFNPGPIDGIFGWRTRAALERYQRSNGLSSGALTKETLSSLGL